mmetsp:Transcript_13759/g.37164  ORF Transcript_13759/g.37164 Transcript_13759/m.37164 type:complete len:218 (-) Transcript_13759:1392-2045(-)
MTSTSLGRFRNLGSKLPTTNVGLSTRFVTSVSKSSPAVSGTTPPMSAAAAVTCAHMLLRLEPCSKQMLAALSTPSYASALGTCASGCSEFRSSRVTRPACRLPHTKGSSMSPNKANSHRTGRLKVTSPAPHFMDLRKDSEDTRPGSASVRTSAAGRPTSLTFANTYSTPLASACFVTSPGATPFFLQKPSKALVGLPSAAKAALVGGPRTSDSCVVC